MITNNGYARDSRQVRFLRLDAIQTNWGAVAPLLAPVPADLGLWAATCHTDYTALRNDWDEKIEIEEGATIARNLPRHGREYSVTREYAKARYAADPQGYHQLKLNEDYPDKIELKLPRVELFMEQCAAGHLRQDCPMPLPQNLRR